MHRCRTCRPLAWLIATLLCTGLAAAQSTRDLEKLLEAPVTAGTEALLVRHASDERVPLRWLANLRHADPLVRVTAARALAATGVRTALGPLREALGAETDSEARVEQALALVMLGQGADDATALQALAGTGGLERGLLVVAAARPDTFVSLVAQLEKAGELPLRPAVGRLLLTATKAQRSAFVEAAAERGGPLLGALLLAAASHSQDVPADGLAKAATDRTLADALLQFVASRYERPGVAMPSHTPLKLEVSAESGEASDWTPPQRVSRELTRRWMGLASAVDLTKDIGALPNESGGGTTALLSPLSADERQAFLRRFEHRRAQFETDMEHGRVNPAADRDNTPASVLTTLPRGLHAAIVEATRCRAKDKDDRIAEVSYRPDGRPRQVRFADDVKPSSACQAAAEAMLMLHRESIGHDPVRPHLLLVRLDEQQAACQAASPRPTPPDDDMTGSFDAPRKTRDVKPNYPMSMQRQRVQGVVIIDMIISDEGCVASARVLRSVAPTLDLAALQAASRWTYAPLQHGDHTHATVMTVTVNFLLQ